MQLGGIKNGVFLCGGLMFLNCNGMDELRTAIIDDNYAGCMRLLGSAVYGLNETYDGKTMLHVSMVYGGKKPEEQIKIVDLLLAHGADVNAQAIVSRETAVMMMARKNKSSAVLAFLLSRGADIHSIYDEFENTALQLALYFGNHSAVTMLLKHSVEDTQLPLSVNVISMQKGRYLEELAATKKIKRTPQTDVHFVFV